MHCFNRKPYVQGRVRMPKLSVIVPVYNTEKYLPECIDSILAQTYTDFELILVDDGSTDRSGAICEEYAHIDPRIHVIHQSNGGVTKARKVGSAYSKGEYVTFVDSDDWIDLDTYEFMMSKLGEDDPDMCIFAMTIERKDPGILTNGVGEGSFLKEKLRRMVYPKMLFDYNRNSAGIIPSLCNKIIKSSILKNAIKSIPDDLEYGEDAITGYLAILNSSSVCVYDRPFYHYRDNPSSISHADPSIMEKRILALERVMRSCFSGYETDLSAQIDGHITHHVVEHVRKVLLYSSVRSVSERISAVRDFCELPQIKDSMKRAFPRISNKKEKIKVLLIRYKLFHILYFLFKKA